MRRRGLAVVAGFLLLAGWILYVLPAARIQRLSREWSALKSEREEARHLLDRFYGEKVELIPERSRLSGFLEALHEQARRHQVQILEVSPGAVPDPRPGEPALYPVGLQLEGEYQALGEFLGELRDPSGGRLISIRQMRIGGEEGRLPRLRAQLSMEIALQ